MLLETPGDIARSSPWAFALRAFAVVAIVAMALPTLRGAPLIYGPPLTEDGYYALTVAKNLAQGRGMTIDGTTLSNGFQPLFTVIEALAFAIGGGDDTLALRFVLLFAWAFHAGGAILCGSIAREIWPARHGAVEVELRVPLAAIFYLGSPLLFGHAYNGLATGCVLFFYLAVIRWLQVGGAESTRGRIILGILIGLMVLARIDAAFFAIAIGLHLLWTNRAAGWSACIGRSASVALTALCVSGPWWAYNILDFGSFLPTSGEALQSSGLTPARAHYALWALRAVLMPWIFFGQLDDHVGFATATPQYWGFGYISAASTVRLILIAAIAAILWRAVRRRAFADDFARLGGTGMARARRGLMAVGLLLSAVVPLIVYYTFFFGSYWFYYRYFMPLAILPFLAAPVAVARAIPAARRAARIAVAALAVAGIQAVGWPALALDGWTFNPEAVYFDQVALARANVPADEFLAAGQSGTLGYFRTHVVNTDGKVNLDALKYKGRIWDYLRTRRVRWYVDWPYYVNRHLGVPLDPETGLPARTGNGWHYVAERNGFYLYRYDPAVAP
ncbi:MAG: hypothetical protein JNL71_16495 [Rhodospirillales bacterium]|nr:hypothetical protein [Rhodospirillales bacterium]